MLANKDNSLSSLYVQLTVRIHPTKKSIFISMGEVEMGGGQMEQSQTRGPRPLNSVGKQPLAYW